MFNYILKQLTSIFSQSLVALALIIAITTPSEAWADQHYFSLKSIFQNGKCTPVIPNYELMAANFIGGELTKYKIHDRQGRVIEVISIFANKERDQWVMVGSKTVTKVIFCLYSSGTGKDSFEREVIR